MKEARIAIVIDKRGAFSRAMLKGVTRYARPARPWVFHTLAVDDRWSSGQSAPLRAWRPTGILAQSNGADMTAGIEAEFGSMGVPVIDISVEPALPGRPHVGLDHVAVGRMVATEFIAQGLRHAAYVGWGSDGSNSQFAGLESGFAGVPGSSVHRVSNHLPPVDEINGWSAVDEFLARWLRGLPAPLGLMLYDDRIANWMTQACSLAHLRVPEDVSIIGVYDDETNCQFAYPAVSSVEVPGERIGYEAARMLDKMMGGSQAESSPHLLLPPVGVVTRPSSDVVAVDDGEVASAVRFIRQNAHRPLRVSDVLDVVEVSPRQLEKRFRRLLGRTPAAEIQRVHINRAAQLLAQTNLPLRTIAKRSGFADIHHLCHAFRRIRGQTPNQYRRQFAIGAAPEAEAAAES